jgi:transcriptional regulator with XRE-family HTH domain
MTQHDVAERLERLARTTEGLNVGVNADMVSKWERGEKRPSALYTRLLCELFGTLPGEWALQMIDGLKVAGDCMSGLASASVLDMLEVPGRNAAVAQLLRPKMLELGRQELLNRRQVLLALGISPAAVGLNALEARFPSSSASPQAGLGLVDGLSEATRELEVLYHSADPRRLLLPVSALIATIEDALPGISDRRRRCAALGLLARSNLLAGRLTFFDVRRPVESRGHLDLAREAAELAGDDLMTSVVFGHMAFLPAAKHNHSAAASYLSAARKGASLLRTSCVSSWLSAVEGELNTWAGSFDAARRCHDRARIALPESSPSPEWFDFFDAARLAGFEGYTLRACGDMEGARAKLSSALEPCNDMSPKQRSVMAIDLAAVCFAGGDVDEGCRLAGAAARDLREVGYATGVERLTALRRLIPSARHPAARFLDELLAGLTSEERP